MFLCSLIISFTCPLSTQHHHIFLGISFVPFSRLSCNNSVRLIIAQVPRRKRVVSLGTFEVAVPSPSELPHNSTVDAGFAELALNFDPQILVGQSTIVPGCYSFENTGITSGYSPGHNPIYFSGIEENPQKRRRLIGFNSMPSADESSSSSMGNQEKLPIGDHDSASITPRWAPGISDVQSLSAPLARVAESITNCCTFGWQQQPAGMQAVLPLFVA